MSSWIARHCSTKNNSNLTVYLSVVWKNIIFRADLSSEAFIKSLNHWIILTLHAHRAPQSTRKAMHRDLCSMLSLSFSLVCIRVISSLHCNHVTIQSITYFASFHWLKSFYHLQSYIRRRKKLFTFYCLYKMNFSRTPHELLAHKHTIRIHPAFALIDNRKSIITPLSRNHFPPIVSLFIIYTKTQLFLMLTFLPYQHEHEHTVQAYSCFSKSCATCCETRAASWQSDECEV